MGINKEFPDPSFLSLEIGEDEKKSDFAPEIKSLSLEENILSPSSGSSSSALDPNRVKIINTEKKLDLLEDDFGESLDLFLKDHLLEIPSDNPFFDTDVLVFKDYQGILPSNGMTVAEFEEAVGWLNELKTKQSAGSLKIEGDEFFSKTICDSIKTLCQRRVGRELLKKLIDCEKETKIVYDPNCRFAHADIDNYQIVINPDPKQIALGYVQGQKFRSEKHPLSSIKDAASLEEFPFFIAMAHEMVHILHAYQSESDTRMRVIKNLDDDFYVDQLPYHNMEEFLTITGWSDLSLDELKKSQTWEGEINKKNADTKDWDLEDDKKRFDELKNGWSHLNENSIRAVYSKSIRLGHDGSLIKDESTKIGAFLDAAKAGRIEQMEQMWKELSDVLDPIILSNIGAFSRDDVFEKLYDLVAAKDMKLIPPFLESALRFRTHSPLTFHLISKYFDIIKGKNNAEEMIALISKVATRYCSVEEIKELFNGKIKLSSLIKNKKINKDQIDEIFLSSLYNSSIEVSKFIEESYILNTDYIPFFKAYQACIQCNSMEKVKYIGDLSKGNFDPSLIRKLCIESTKKGQKDKFIHLYPSIISRCRMDLSNCPSIIISFMGDKTIPFPLKFFPPRDIKEQDFPELIKNYLSEENTFVDSGQKNELKKYAQNEEMTRFLAKNLIDDYAIDFSPLRIISELANAQKMPLHTVISLFFFLKGEVDFAKEFIKLAPPPGDAEKMMAYELYLQFPQHQNQDLINFILDNKIIEIPNEEQEKVLKEIYSDHRSFSEIAKTLQQEHRELIKPYFSGISLLVFLVDAHSNQITEDELSSGLLEVYQNLGNNQEKRSEFWTIIENNSDLFKESTLNLLKEKIQLS